MGQKPKWTSNLRNTEMTNSTYVQIGDGKDWAQTLQHLNKKHLKTMQVILNSATGCAPLPGFPQWSRIRMNLSLTRGKRLLSSRDHQASGFSIYIFGWWQFSTKKFMYIHLALFYFIRGTEMEIKCNLFFPFLHLINTKKRVIEKYMWKSRKEFSFSLRNMIEECVSCF